VLYRACIEQQVVGCTWALNRSTPYSRQSYSGRHWGQTAEHRTKQQICDSCQQPSGYSNNAKGEPNIGGTAPGQCSSWEIKEVLEQQRGTTVTMHWVLVLRLLESKQADYVFIPLMQSKVCMYPYCSPFPLSPPPYCSQNIYKSLHFMYVSIHLPQRAHRTNNPKYIVPKSLTLFSFARLIYSNKDPFPELRPETLVPFPEPGLLEIFGILWYIWKSLRSFRSLDPTLHSFRS
jgi:hypothetical protein